MTKGKRRRPQTLQITHRKEILPDHNQVEHFFFYFASHSTFVVDKGNAAWSPKKNLVGCSTTPNLCVQYFLASSEIIFRSCELYIQKFIR